MKKGTDLYQSLVEQLKSWNPVGVLTIMPVRNAHTTACKVANDFRIQQAIALSDPGTNIFLHLYFEFQSALVPYPSELPNLAVLPK